MNQCYEGDYIDNPYHTRQYGDDTPEFGSQDHSKKNNPLDKGIAYENFCPDPKPPALDALFPQLGQGTDIGLEPKLSLNLMDSSENMDITTGSSDMDLVACNPNFMTDGTLDPSVNLFENNEIASAGASDFGDNSLIKGRMNEITISANDELTDPVEDLFRGPSDEGSSYTFTNVAVASDMIAKMVLGFKI